MQRVHFPVKGNLGIPAYDTDKRMTWEECLDICKQVTKVENGTTTCWGIIGDQINRVWNVMPLANSLGAAWLDEDGLTATGLCFSPLLLTTR